MLRALVVAGLAAGSLAAAAVASVDESLRARLARIERVRVAVDQAYSYRPAGALEARPLTGVALPFARLAARLLRAAGIAVVERPEEAEATLEIRARGQTRARRYPGFGAGGLYVGATLTGEIVYRAPGFAPWRTPFGGRVFPPFDLGVNLGYERPENAPFERAFALYASFLPRLLAVIGSAHGAGPLIAALDADDDAALRRAAARALGDLGDRVAVAPLVAALEDPDDEVRRQAAWALGRLGDRAAVAPLRRALGDRSDDVRWFAAWALSRITGVPIDEISAEDAD